MMKSGILKCRDNYAKLSSFQLQTHAKFVH